MFGGKQYDDNNSEISLSAPAGKPETIIGPSVRVDGQFKGDGNMLIEGEVKGSIKTKQHLRVGDGARVKANVEAGSAEIAGEITGNLKVKQDLHVLSSARILGNIDVKTIEVAAGALISGNIKMEIEGVSHEAMSEIEMPDIIKEKTKCSGVKTNKSKDKNK